MTTDTASFAHTEPLASHRPAPAIGPVTATRRTRIVYCMALIGMPLGMLFASRSWVGMVFGGGPITTLGPVAFFLIAAAVLYRIYRVARYPSALDARPPSVLGRILRGLAWIVMAVGAAGMAGLFLGGPLAVLLFGTGGPDGIVVFAAGIVAVVLASVGWIGCVIFEASRLFGTRVASAQPRTRRQRLQDWSVLAVVVVLAVVPVTVFKLLEGEICFDLAACVAQVEGGVSRRLAVPLAAPVTLQTNIEGIEYRQLHGKKEWVRTEIPAFSLLRAGHPVATTSAPVQVSLQATPVKKGVAVVLTVRENGEQTARFTTTFGSAARIVPSSNGRSKVAITLPRGVVESRDVAPGEGTLDVLFQQLRSAIGSPREVAEETKRVKVTAAPVGASDVDKKWPPQRLDDSCSGLLKMEERGQAEYDPKLAIPMSELVFVQSPDTRVTVLLRWDDNAVCTGGGVWLAQAMRWREGLLELRKYDMQGSLQHSLLVSLPPAPSPEDYAVFMQHRLTERNGNIEFAYLARSGNRRRLEHYRVKL